MSRKEGTRERRFNRFDLNLLRALDALLEERNVTHAASRLCVTQPAMSAALQRMRDFFDDQLLVRVGREMELTPRARSLIGPVHELLLLARDTLDIQPSFDPKATRRAFRIAMSDYAALVLMPRVFARLSMEAPYLACHVEALTNVSFARLTHNDVDFCVSSDDWRLFGDIEHGSDIRTSPLFTDEFVCVVDRRHCLVEGDLSRDAYVRAPHAAVRMAVGLSSIVDHAWTLADLRLNIVATAPSFATLLLMIAGTPLVATTQGRLADILARGLPLRRLPCPIPMPTLREVLVWHARNDFDPGHVFMRAVIEEAAQEIATAGSSTADAVVRAMRPDG